MRVHRVPVRVWGGLVTPRFTRFYVVPQVGARLSRIKALTEELAFALGASSCRISRQGASLHVEVLRAHVDSVTLVSLMRRIESMPPVCSLVGVDDEGTPTLIRHTSPDVAHVLICGSTGSGKTVLARTMIATLGIYNSPRQVQMMLIDPKSRGFGPLAGLPHLLCPIIHETDEARGRLQWLVHEMERRDRECITAPRILVFIDEFADLMLVGGGQVEKAMTRLSQRGRQAGIHLVACTQKPTAAVIGSLVKSNFPLRAVGSVTSAEDAKVATGMAGTGAEKLVGRGDFLLVNRGETFRFQAAYASDADIQDLVAALHRRSSGNRCGATASLEVGPKDAGWKVHQLRVVRS